MRRIGALALIIAMALVLIGHPYHPSDINPGDPSVVLDNRALDGPPVGSFDIRELGVDYFTENSGQFGMGAGDYYIEGDPLSVAFGKGWVSYRLAPSSTETGCLVRVEFLDSNQVEPRGIEPLTHRTNYIRGDDPAGWVTGASSYERVRYTDLWDGIDLVYRVSSGRLKYDLVVGPGADPGSIAFSFEGMDDLSVDEEGRLCIWTGIGILFDDAPVAYQEAPGQRLTVQCRFRVLDGDTVRLDVEGRDPHLPLTIDPGLDFSTHIGGNATGSMYQQQEELHDMFVDASGDVYVAGWTRSSDFPTTSGAYDASLGGTEDAFVLKLEQDGKSLVYSTFIGGGGDERALALDVDGSGNAYVTGWTSSANFPTRPGAYDRRLDGDSDAFVVRLDPTGARLPAATYLGGSDDDYGQSIMLDGKGGVHVGGAAYSNDFPTTAGAYDTVRGGLQDAFLTVLNMTLTDVSYSTYIGGSGYDSVGDLWVDGYDNAYISGYTTSADFPVSFPSFDAKSKGVCNFILKFDIDDSSMTYAGYVDGYDTAIVVDDYGHLYATGYTHADDLPVTDGAYDTEYNGNWEAFVLKLKADGSGFEFLTYLGGSSIDYGYDICLNATGCPSVTGQTSSRDFPTTPNAYDDSMDAYSRDVFYSMLNANGSILLYSTYIGGDNEDWGSAIALQGDDHVVIGGVTNSSDFPVTPGAFDGTRDGSYDAFVLKMPVETIDPRPPSEPLNLSAMGGDGHIGLGWARPADDGGIGIRGYRLCKGNSSDNLTWLADLEPLETSYFDRAVENGMTYWYTVVAFNQMGSGPRAPVVNATPRGPPSPPVGLIAEGGRGNVSLDWRSPLRDGGLPVLGYRLYRGASMFDIEHLADLGNVTSYLDTDVVNGQVYHYKLLAFNSLGNGTFSKVVSAVPIGLPSEPLFPRARAVGEGIQLDWRPPGSDGGRAILGYMVFRGLSEDDLVSIANVTSGTTFDDGAVDFNVSYFYAVSAFNDGGVGPMSDVVDARVLGPPSNVTNLVAEARLRSVRLIWGPCGSDHGSPVQGYIIHWGVKGEGLGEGVDVGTNRSIDVTDLEPGIEYTFQVVAVNSMGEGPSALVDSTPLDLPGPVDDLEIQAGDGILLLEWSAPADGGSPVTGYVVKRGVSRDDLRPLADVPAGASEHRDEDVQNSVLYWYQVIAVSELGEGSKGPAVSATPVGPPGPPTGLNITCGDGWVLLIWEVPADDSGSPVTGYVILRGDSPSNLTERARDVALAYFNDTEVDNGVTYHYAVGAINKARDGPHSDCESGNPVPKVTRPNPPREVSATVRGRTVELTWSEPEFDGGSPIVGYIISRGTSEDDMEVIMETGPDRSHTDTGLRRGTRYYYRIASKNGLYESDPTEVMEAKVPESESPGPMAPMALVAIAAVVVWRVRRRG